MDREDKLAGVIQWYADRLSQLTLELAQTDTELRAAKIQLAEAEQKLQDANAMPGDRES